MAPRSFKKVAVAVSGTFPGYKQADLKALVEQQGASFHATVSSDCTHLITTQKDVDKKNEKCMFGPKRGLSLEVCGECGADRKDKSACGISTCEVVGLDWLLESVDAKKPLPTKKYLLGSDAAGSDGHQQDDQDGGKKSKKRTIDAVDGTKTGKDADDESNKKVKDEQEKKLNVPVDEGFSQSGYRVYIDDSGEIWDATLNQTNSGANNNKFYLIQVLVSPGTGDCGAWTRWGRVGEHGQSAMLGDGSLENAQSEFQKKFKSKSGLAWSDRLKPAKPNKYAFLERNYEESDDEDEELDKGSKKQKKEKKEKKEEDEEEKEEEEVESSLSAPIQNLMSFIFNRDHFVSVMASMSYDAQKLPLGKLSKRTLQEGFRLLKELSELIDKPSTAQATHNMSYMAAVEHLSNRYFTTIPHVFGRNKPPVLQNDQLLKKECELLETLTDMGVTNEIMKGPKEKEKIHEIDRQFNSLGLQEMTVVQPKTAEYKELESYLYGSQGRTHHLKYKVESIFRIERPEEERRRSETYDNIPVSDRRLLWHGSRSTNYGGILSQGLRIAPPEAPVSGYMFGKGVYFADMSSKSAGYCWSFSSGNMGLLLLCDVELGYPMYEQKSANSNAAKDSKDAGSLATLGCGRTVPVGWKDAGCVHPTLEGVRMPDVTESTSEPYGDRSLQYNEYIVYDVKQIQQRYLLHVRIH